MKVFMLERLDMFGIYFSIVKQKGASIDGLSLANWPGIIDLFLQKKLTPICFFENLTALMSQLVISSFIQIV